MDASVVFVLCSRRRRRRGGETVRIQRRIGPSDPGTGINKGVHSFTQLAMNNGSPLYQSKPSGIERGVTPK